MKLHTVTFMGRVGNIIDYGLRITDYELRITDDLQGCREVLITKYEVPLGKELV